MLSQFRKGHFGQTSRVLPSKCLFRSVPRRNLNISMVDWEPIKAKQKQSGFGSKIVMGLLVLIPVVSFSLGTWQVKRLNWKTDLIAKSEHRLTLTPLPLPSKLDPAIVDSGDFDYRRVLAVGKFRHDQEMLVGPRMHEGREGFHVVTPLERKDGSKLLIFRGWIAKDKLEQSSRAKEALPTGEVTVQCMLKRKPQKNSFTPDDHPERREYYFMNIDEMARQTDAQAVYIQELLHDTYDGREFLPEQLMSRGIPIGTPAKVSIRNSHFQYIITWYSLSALTTFMLFRLVKQSRASSVNSAVKKKLEHAKKFE